MNIAKKSHRPKRLTSNLSFALRFESAAQKREIAAAAQADGRSLNNFIVRSAQAAAQQRRKSA